MRAPAAMARGVS